MRALVQRVTAATVSVEGVAVASITPRSQGLLVLVGVRHDDTPETARRMAEKLWRLRILDDGKAAADIGAPILVVSQFTLYADTAKGRRPSWNGAAPASSAQPVVDAVVAALAEMGAQVATGVFGAHMQVESINDGPVTVMLEL